MGALQSFGIKNCERVSCQRSGVIRAPGEHRRGAMTPRVREGQSEQCIMRGFGKGAELAAIGKEIVQRQHRHAGASTA
jgi:hypothetical protein